MDLDTLADRVMLRCETYNGSLQVDQRSGGVEYPDAPAFTLPVDRALSASERHEFDRILRGVYLNYNEHLGEDDGLAYSLSFLYSEGPNGTILEVWPDPTEF